MRNSNVHFALSEERGIDRASDRGWFRGYSWRMDLLAARHVARIVCVSLAAIAVMTIAGLPHLAVAQGEEDLCSNGIVIAIPTENAELVADCEILLAVRVELADDAILNWSAQVPLDEWQGIGVDAEVEPARVAVLLLVGHGESNVLTGFIPAELGELAGLESLSLAGNRLTGTIPPELGRLSKLQELRLNHNRLTGSIPEALGEIAGLRSLSLNDNQLTGLIPARLGRLTDLESVDFDNNRLTGDIPAGLSNLTNLWVLWLGGNQLGGCLPQNLDSRGANDLAELGMPPCSFQARLAACRDSEAFAEHRDNQGLIEDCATLLEIRDMLAGDASLNWSAQLAIQEWEGISVGADNPSGMLRVTDLSIVERELTGFIPAAIGRLTQLDSLWLGGNQLAGEIPRELGNLSELTLLSLYTNEFTGEIPPELGRLSKMYGMSLEYNRLTGAIPPELNGMRLLEGLWLKGNDFAGCLPHTLHGTSDDLHLLGMPPCPGWEKWGQCFYGNVIEQAVDNPGLVHDCSVLLEVKEKLAGGTS